MTKNERYGKLRHRIHAAKTFWEDNFKVQEETNLNFYIGKQWGSEWSNFPGRITNNIILPIIRTIIPSLIYQYPTFTVKTDDPTQQGYAYTAERALNNWFRVLRGKQTSRRCVLDCLVFRYGIAKVGWNYLVEDVPLTEDELMMERENLLTGLMASGEPMPELEMVEKLIPRERRVAIKDQPVISRVSTKRWWPDPELEALEDIQDKDSYCVEEELLSLERVKADKRFKSEKKLLDELEGSVVPTYALNLSTGAQDEFKKVRLRHIYYYENSRLNLAIFAEKQEKPLFEDDEQGSVVQFPYALLKNMEVPDQLAGIPEVQDLIQPQKERNKLRTIIFDHNKKFLRKYGLLENSDPDGKIEHAMKNPEDGTIVKCQTPNDIFIIPHAEIPGDIWKSDEMSTRDIEFRTQVSNYTMGLMPDQRRLATEVIDARAAASAISEDRLNTVSEFIGDIGRMLLHELQANMPPDQWVKLEPEQYRSLHLYKDDMSQGFELLNRAPEDVPVEYSQELFMRYNKTHLNGDLQVEVVVGSTLPESANVRRKAALDRYNLFRQDPLINPMKLLPEAIQESGAKGNPNDYILPPQPMAPSMMEPEAGHGGVVQEPFVRNKAINAHMMGRQQTDADIQRGGRNAVQV